MSNTFKVVNTQIGASSMWKIKSASTSHYTLKKSQTAANTKYRNAVECAAKTKKTKSILKYTKYHKKKI